MVINDEISEKIREAEKIVEECIKKYVENDPNYLELKEDLGLLFRSSKDNVRIIYGRGGIGKSTAIRNIMKEFKEKYGIRYLYITRRLEHLKNIISLFENDKINKEEAKKFIEKLLENIDVIIFDDSKVSARFQELLIEQVDKYNKKIIFVVNDVEELENIPKIAYNRGLSIEYDLSEETLNKIIKEISARLNIPLNIPPFNLRIIEKLTAKIVYKKATNENIDVKRLINVFLAQEINQAKSFKQKVINIGKYLLSMKKDKITNAKELAENIKIMLTKVLGYSYNTVYKKNSSTIKEVAEMLMLTYGDFDRILEEINGENL